MRRPSWRSAFFFAIAAALLNPIEMAIGIVLGTPAVFALTYFAFLRRRARDALAGAAPALIHEREEPGPPRGASRGRWRARSPSCCSSPGWATRRA